eukprot:Blabericola_migrator_1__2502@NODE_1703_length_3971_cov_12_704918_g597_i1_p2_GENE_NODE_1703_length_3971_cov_12_704918_g597_i1NODE_1703_length_3971_cov_12_704918_g597_i1_p2_ORF_typecomplete_len103_score8_79_NODE_1703_length_3971_cov_12_704918_g597_i117592067
MKKRLPSDRSRRSPCDESPIPQWHGALSFYHAPLSPTQLLEVKERHECLRRRRGVEDTLFQTELRVGLFHKLQLQSKSRTLLWIKCTDALRSKVGMSSNTAN